MNKDVIYIDVEDDITAIIGKVKSSKDKVVALVPPKRVGVLQSAVNLRLLARAAKQSDKHLALVTNNQSLIALASAASIPVAKNLQSKPELAEIPALSVDDEDDIIDGGDLPIGEHAKQAEDTTSDVRSAEMVAALAAAPTADQAPVKPKVKKNRVPNFDTFRKKMLFIGLAVVALILFLIWALFIAPRATVVISAKTNSSSINVPVTLTTLASTDSAANTLKATLQQQEADKTQSFTATGKKDAGSKAKGTVTFSTDSISVASRNPTIPAGTRLTSSSGQVFVTDTSVTLSLSNSSDSSTVTAAENGSAYNAASGDVSGTPNGVSGAFDGPTSGGLTKMITVVSNDDVLKAKLQIAESNTDDIKKMLTSKFPTGSLVVDQSFAVDYGDVKVSPAVGEEATQATLSTTVAYKLYGVEKSQIDNFLNSYLAKQLNSSSTQRVYKNGADGALFQDATTVENGAKATLIATAQLGPKIDDAAVKNQSKGKRYGDIQQSIESIQGVESVDVKFFPFWVNTVPSNDSRITIEFKLDESK